MEGHNCNTCGEYKLLSDFIKSKTSKNGIWLRCKSCRNEYQRIGRAKSSNFYTKTYEKTINGYLMRTYRNMLSRVKGILKKKAHIYEGLEIATKEEFYEWSLKSNFINLLEDYKESGYDMKLAPSVDRKDPLKGYSLCNIRWITHSENSANTRRNAIE